jgi:hypothetical protein
MLVVTSTPIIISTLLSFRLDKAVFFSLKTKLLAHSKNPSSEIMEQTTTQSPSLMRKLFVDPVAGKYIQLSN